MGALPLSKRADADVKDVKDQLDKLSKKITDTAEKVHTHTHSNFFVIKDFSNNRVRDYSLAKAVPIF